MPDRLESESLFLEHLRHIERVAAIACTNHGVWGDEADDFASWIKLKLMEDDYATIQRFRGESSIKTYLTLVVRRQFNEYRREQGGRWRPSAAAERLGQLAKDLESLVYRQGYRLDQAAEKLRTAGRTNLSGAELGRLLEQLPRRKPQRPIEVPADATLSDMQATSRPDTEMDEAKAEALHDRLTAALDRAMGSLDPEDRLIARMHIADGRKLADVARALGLEPKPLYRRLEKVLRHLRAQLEADGVRDTDVRGILGEEDGH